MNKYYIRPITETDVDLIFEIESLCFSSPMTKENIRSILLGKMGIAFVCFDTENEDRLVGYGGMFCVADEAQILNIATHPSFRGKGIGRLVTSTLVQYAVSRGTSYITLEVRESHHVAIGLYKSLGFYEVGRIKKYYKMPLEDGLIMKLDVEK